MKIIILLICSIPFGWLAANLDFKVGEFEHWLQLWRGVFLGFFTCVMILLLETKGKFIFPRLKPFHLSFIPFDTIQFIWTVGLTFTFVGAAGLLLYFSIDGLWFHYSSFSFFTGLGTCLSIYALTFLSSKLKK